MHHCLHPHPQSCNVRNVRVTMTAFLFRGFGQSAGHLHMTCDRLAAVRAAGDSAVLYAVYHHALDAVHAHDQVATR